MKKSLRFASAALAVALAASCAAPAFAAGGSSFTKSETVYAVMNADGSIQSTTVSEHVYSASGLSKVTDQSTLTNIQNTESSAAFTQDGEKLVWNTDDTDVYYKGDTTRALPIQATVTYALDGQEAALEERSSDHDHRPEEQRDRHRERERHRPHHRHPAGHRCGRDLRAGCHQRGGCPRSGGKRRQEQCGCLCHPAGREGFPVRSAAGRTGHH